MIMYSATLNAVAVSAAQDVFEIVAPSGGSVRLAELILSQYSDFADAQDEILSVLLMRGHTTAGSGGAAVTPRPFNRYLPAARTVVNRNNTTVASNGTIHTLIADAFNVRAGWYWKAPPLDLDRFKAHLASSPYAGIAARMGNQIILGPGERAVLRITAPADEITMNATAVFEEILP